MHDFKIIIDIDLSSENAIKAFEEVKREIKQTIFKDAVSEICVIEDNGEGKVHIDYNKKRDGRL